MASDWLSVKRPPTRRLIAFAPVLCHGTGWYRRFGPYSREDLLDLYEAYRNLDGRRKGKVALRDLIKTPFIEANADFRALLERQYYGREGGETRQVTLSEALKMTFPLVSKAERRQVMVLIDMYEHHLGRTTRKAAVDLNTQRLTTLKALFQVRRRVAVVEDWASHRLGSCVCLWSRRRRGVTSYAMPCSGLSDV